MDDVKDLVFKIQGWILSFLPESKIGQTVVAGVVTCAVLYLLTKRRYRLPPGPRGLPLVGNMFSLGKTALYKKSMEWSKMYGPIITIKFGPVNIVCLNNLEIIQEALINKATDFAGRPVVLSTSVLTEGNKDIASTNYGPTWALHRRLALTALKNYMKGNYLEETIRDVMESTVEELRAIPGALDPDRYLKLTTFNLLSKICFNERFASDNEEFLEYVRCLDAFHTEFKNGFLEDILPVIRFCPTPMFRKFKKNTDYMLGFIKKRVNRHKATFFTDTQRDFTDAILFAQKEAEAVENPELMAQFTDIHVGQTIADVFAAGYNTSQQTLYWAVLYAAAYPEMQAKVHENVDSALGSRSTAIMSDRPNLAYTQAFLYEVMRSATVVPLGLPHCTTCDTTIRDYELPKGTMVVPNLYAIHHDPEYWDKPMDFRPERFLDASGKVNPKVQAWLPFSAGKRSCMAESLAKPELLLIVASLLRNFEIRMAEGETANLEALAATPFAYAPHPYKVELIDRRTR